jgi:ATP phosphoribosyltransferase regulatory subunit HisZ
MAEWRAKTKRDLIIEVWESLDCESVGAKELEKIARVVEERYGEGAVDLPASLARLLADEGAELRHAEILELDVQTRAFDPYQAMFRNVLKFADFKQALASIQRLENLRKQFGRKRDAEGLRLVREMAEKGRHRALMISRNSSVDRQKRLEKAEIAEWFSVWLRQPEIFQDWVELRQRSPEFKKRFKDASES